MLNSTDFLKSEPASDWIRLAAEPDSDAPPFVMVNFNNLRKSMAGQADMAAEAQFQNARERPIPAR